MQSYCDFNPRLFKQFTSMKTKIVPAMADDWEMIPEQYVHAGGFGLYSKKLNQTVQDINLIRFLRFCKEQGLKIDALKLEGEFIIGNDRSVYTKEHFETWRAKFEKRTSVIIPYKDAIPGHLYKTPCGSEVLYLGFKYVSSMRVKQYGCTDFFDITKVVKKHFVYSGHSDATTLTTTNVKEYSWSLVSTATQKFTKDLGASISKEVVEALLTEHYKSSIRMTCMLDTKPKVEEYEFVQIPIGSYAVIIRNGNRYWAAENLIYTYISRYSDNTPKTDTYVHEYDIDTRKRINTSEKREMAISSAYRVNIVQQEKIK